jgi:hypothetical protein
MNSTAQSLSIKACYSKAWKSFAKWWIPICLVSGALMVFSWIPKQLAKAESSAMSQSIAEIMAAVEANDLNQLEVLTTELIETMRAYASKVLTFSLYAAPFAALLTVLLYCVALMAVKDQRTRYSPKGIVVVTLFQFVIATVKILLLFLFLPLGIFIYIKLYFVSLLMLEDEKPIGEAIKGSWATTAGNFWPLLAMVTINSLFQTAMAITVIGLIPATGFANTTRAAAFAMLHIGPPQPEKSETAST